MASTAAFAPEYMGTEGGQTLDATLPVLMIRPPRGM